MKRVIDSLYYKNNKFLYYFKNSLRYFLCPKFIPRKRVAAILISESEYDKNYIRDRVNYYNKLEKQTILSGAAIFLKNFKFIFRKKNRAGGRVYFFDAYEYTRCFPDNLKIIPLFGDIAHIPDEPSIVKSRPISNDNSNSVVMKLEKMRHFMFIKDHKKFKEKKDILVGRGAVYQPHRVKFYEDYFGNPLFDLGRTNKGNGEHPEWWVKPMTIGEHLNYKFILCLEGNDVATNLKWVMSSNSLAVMPKPKYETWFMEGRLVGGKHYIELKDDFSDAEEKIKYYIDNPDEALKIIENAHDWVNQFKDRKREELISILVLQKYFKTTGQI